MNNTKLHAEMTADFKNFHKEIRTAILEAEELEEALKKVNLQLDRLTDRKWS